MTKFTAVRDKNTNGMNYDVTTDDIVARLEKWDELYGVEISDPQHDQVTVHFQTLPEDLDSLAEEIYEFCPDTVEQHFGCFAEMVDTAEEMEQPLPPGMQELIEGVDFEDPGYGRQLLIRSLRQNKQVHLWWD